MLQKGKKKKGKYIQFSVQFTKYDEKNGLIKFYYYGQATT